MGPRRGAAGSGPGDSALSASLDLGSHWAHRRSQQAMQKETARSPQGLDFLTGGTASEREAPEDQKVQTLAKREGPRSGRPFETCLPPRGGMLMGWGATCSRET